MPHHSECEIRGIDGPKLLVCLISESILNQ